MVYFMWVNKDPMEAYTVRMLGNACQYPEMASEIAHFFTRYTRRFIFSFFLGGGGER